MTRAFATLLCLAAWLPCSAGAAAAAAAAAADNTDTRPEELSELIDDGKVSLSFRYRFEHVDDDDFAEKADASTLRSRLSFASGDYRGVSFFVEADDVREILVDDFNAGAGNTPSRSEFPVVADPEGTEVNQAYLDYRGFADTRLRLGRQRINLDNQRFVGGVGWRQNEQTYDAVSVDWNRNGTRVFYALVDNVNRPFGDDVPAGDHRQDPSHLLNVSTDLRDLGRLVGYYYAIDNKDEPAFSTGTAGLRLDGARDLRDLIVGYLAEYALQRDLDNNPSDYRAHYWHLSGSVTFAELERSGRLDALTLSAGWEVQSGDADTAGEAFRTPLATLHAFNGWADRFLSTPDAGLDDRYVKLTAERGPWVAEVHGHLFEAADGGADFGEELDLRLGHRINDHVQFDVIAALFDGDGGLADVTKLWFMVTAQF
ncbi:MAG: alginate export family protein [Pseudomonadales bacterium]